MSSNARIIFLKVSTNGEKLAAICSIVHHHFEQNHLQLITVPSEEAARYIDVLLWRHPEDSFIPHCISNVPSKAPIVITTTQSNLNKAQVLLNLCPTTSQLIREFPFVYELYDETHPTKSEMSQQRYAHYQSMGMNLALKNQTDLYASRN